MNPPKTRQSTSTNHGLDLDKPAQLKMIEFYCQTVLLERSKNNGILPPGRMEDIVKSLIRCGVKKANKDMVNYRVKCLRKQALKGGNPLPESINVNAQSSGNATNTANGASAVSPISNLTDPPFSQEEMEIEAKRQKKGGRPKRSTKVNKLILESNIEAALQYCSKKIIDEKDKCKSLGMRVAKNYTKKVIEGAHETYNLLEGAINYSTVMSRVDRRNHLGVLGVEACITPCIDVEEILVALCVKLVKTGQPLDKTSFLKLATALVTGTETQERKKILAHRKRYVGSH